MKSEAELAPRSHAVKPEAEVGPRSHAVQPEAEEAPRSHALQPEAEAGEVADQEGTYTLCTRMPTCE